MEFLVFFVVVGAVNISFYIFKNQTQRDNGFFVAIKVPSKSIDEIHCAINDCI